MREHTETGAYTVAFISCGGRQSISTADEGHNGGDLSMLQLQT